MGWLDWSAMAGPEILPQRAVGPLVPILPAGYRSGTAPVPAPRAMVDVNRWDRTSPLVAAPNWTPWGYVTPAPGRTMETF